MALEFLEPVSADLKEEIKKYPEDTLSSHVHFYEGEDEIDSGVYQMAILGVRDARLSKYSKKSNFFFESIRLNLYQLYTGNWKVQILDLGNINPGEKVSDTGYVLKSILNSLYHKSIIPIILGGGQDFTFYQYRAYDDFKSMVNLTTADHKFDLGNSDLPLHSQSYVGKMIIDEPYNLFNYTNLGYQTYLSPQYEIDLMEKLFFDAERLGHLKADITISEPILRDTDLFSIDIYSVKSGEIADKTHKNSNGFDTFDLCKLSRYAGMSDNLNSFGVYELQAMEETDVSIGLVAQVLWYFIEGYSLRLNEIISEKNPNFIKYSVPIEDQILVFFKSGISEKWWIKIPNTDNNIQNSSLLACDKQDYLDATHSLIPQRWLKTKYKMSL